MPVKPVIVVASTRWAAQWHTSKNSRSPSEVGLSSEYIAWWRAESCGHEWDPMVATRVRSELECFVCAGRRIVAGFNDLGQGYRVLRVRSGKLPKITDNDLIVHAQWSGALVAEALLPHLDGLGWLIPLVSEETT